MLTKTCSPETQINRKIGLVSIWFPECQNIKDNFWAYRQTGVPSFGDWPRVTLLLCFTLQVVNISVSLIPKLFLISASQYLRLPVRHVKGKRVTPNLCHRLLWSTPWKHQLSQYNILDNKIVTTVVTFRLKETKFRWSQPGQWRSYHNPKLHLTFMFHHFNFATFSDVPELLLILFAVKVTIKTDFYKSRKSYSFTLTSWWTEVELGGSWMFEPSWSLKSESEIIKNGCESESNHVFIIFVYTSI